jgi:hypothetical protein
MDITTGFHASLLENNYNFMSLIIVWYSFNVVINPVRVHYKSLQKGLLVRIRQTSQACGVGRIKFFFKIIIYLLN